jgi:hypothetical protein
MFDIDADPSVLDGQLAGLMDDRAYQSAVG